MVVVTGPTGSGTWIDPYTWWGDTGGIGWVPAEKKGWDVSKTIETITDIGLAPVQPWRMIPTWTDWAKEGAEQVVEQAGLTGIGDFTNVGETVKEVAGLGIIAMLAGIGLLIAWKA